MSIARATVAAFVASFKDCWAFRRQISRVLGVSVRTVQRALTQGQDLGLLRTARAKQGEVPTGARGPIDCGFSHRWTIGWGVAGKRAGEKIQTLIEHARMRRVVRALTPATKARTMKPKPSPVQQRQFTLEELDAELLRIDRERQERGS
jgi:hypothetical protein